jgi:hypothetical protein
MEQEYDQDIHAIVGIMSLLVHVSMEQLLDMPWIDVCFSEVASLWQRISFYLLCGDDDNIRKLQRPQDPNERLGKTFGLLLHLWKSIYLRGFVVILDSGFCVLLSLVELWKKGVFAVAVISTWCCNG